QTTTILDPSQIFQDVSADYAQSTVTIDIFPQAASVNPCRHASVMKKVVQHMNANVVDEQLATWKNSDKYQDK
ncbi:hypothetical protein CY34DRAFT_100059, partial [Suillus luteus UH-Slu-Lm8-n1]